MKAGVSRRNALWILCVALLCGVMGSTPAAPQSAGKLTVLLSNDDGFDAPGLKALAEAFRGSADVTVVAPADNQSGKGHSITTAGNPIMASERRQADGSVWYAIEATPATCVMLALESLMIKKPDVVISGINRGENLGIVVYYSGTVGAAREAAIFGVPAIAVSMQGNDLKDYARVAAYVKELVETLRSSEKLKAGLLLNVNAPAGEARGVKVTRLSTRKTTEIFERRSTPRGRPYFWPDWRPLEEDEEGTDVWAHARKYISVTPMKLDSTALEQQGELKGLESEGGKTKSEIRNQKLEVNGNRINGLTGRAGSGVGWRNLRGPADPEASGWPLRERQLSTQSSVDEEFQMTNDDEKNCTKRR